MSCLFFSIIFQYHPAANSLLSQYFSKLEKMHLKAASSSTATTDSTATTPKEALTTRKRKAVDNTINEDDEEILSNPVKKFKVKVEDDKPKKEEDEDEDVKPKKEEDEDEDEEEEDEEDQDSYVFAEYGVTLMANSLQLL